MPAKKKLAHPGAQTGFFEAVHDRTAWLPPRQGEPGFSVLAEEVLKHEFISADIETFSNGLGDHKRSALKPFYGQIRLITLTANPRKAITLDLGPDGAPDRYDNLSRDILLKASQNCTLIGQNIYFDLLWILSKYGIRFLKVLCTKTMSGIRWAGVKRFAHDIASISRRFGLPEYDKSFGALTDFGGNIGQNEYLYNYLDTLRAIQLLDKLEPELEENGQTEVAELENAVIPAFVDMTNNGIPVNESLLAQFIDQYTDTLRTLTREIKHEARVSPFSSKQVLQFLEKELSTTPDPNEEDFGLTVLQSASTDLLIEKLIDFHPGLQDWCWKVTDARSLRQALAFGTKITKLLYRGKAHPTFNTFTISGTGRVGNRDPNMAAIAKLKKRFEDRGLMAIRKVFTSPDEQLYILDLPGSHGCIAAEASQDSTLIEALGSPGGIHAYTASGMLRLSGYNFTPEYIDKARDDEKDPYRLLCKSTRDNAKPTFYMKLNFGKEKRLQIVLLGSDPPIRIPLRPRNKKDKGNTAQCFSEAWEKTYSTLFQYQKDLGESANNAHYVFDGVSYGAVTNLLGRRIYIPKFEEGVSIPQANMQQWMSTEADWIKRIQLQTFYYGLNNPQTNLRIVNSQHDEENAISNKDPKIVKEVSETLIYIAMSVTKKILPRISKIPAIEQFLYKSFSKKVKGQAFSLCVNSLNDK